MILTNDMKVFLIKLMTKKIQEKLYFPYRYEYIPNMKIVNSYVMILNYIINYSHENNSHEDTIKKVTKETMIDILESYRRRYNSIYKIIEEKGLYYVINEKDSNLFITGFLANKNMIIECLKYFKEF